MRPDIDNGSNDTITGKNKVATHPLGGGNSIPRPKRSQNISLTLKEGKMKAKLALTLRTLDLEISNYRY